MNLLQSYVEFMVVNMIIFERSYDDDLK